MTMNYESDIKFSGQNQEADEQLAEKCRKKDPFAFQQLMRRHMRSILNFAAQYSKDPAEAEDIAQDTFYKVWKNIRRYKSGRPFRPWLYTIARNTALDQLKKKKPASFSELNNKNQPDQDDPFETTLEDPEPLQPKIFEDAALAETINKTLTNLPPDQRATLVLHYYEMMTFEEISSVLDRPINTVKSWHRRGILHLRQILKNRL